MKTILQTTIIFLVITSLSYGQANTTLSNLVSPTAVNQSLIPGNNNGRNLGSAAKSWRSIYLDSIVYLRDVKFMHSTGTQNAFVGEGAGNAITTGKNNAAFGYHALYTTKTQSFNTAFGSFALSNNVGANNTAIGYSALFSNTTGYQNTATGDSALFYNTTGINNTANGFQALYHSITGSDNTANGVYALTSNTTGDVNTADGYKSLRLNTTGEQNTATGYAALENNNGNYNSAHGTAALNNNSTGIWNTASGAYAMRLNTTGYYNTATGGNALYSNTGGSNNTAYGYNALYNDTADYNTAIGESALYANTTGGVNTAVGKEALYFNNIGYENTAMGYDACLHNTEGFENTGNGVEALFSNTTGSNNTATGYQAFSKNTTGGDNTVIGAGADANSNNYNYSSAFGVLATITASSQIRIGSISGLSPNSIGGFVDWSTLSDVRVKKNIKENVPGLIFINKLRPITYTIDNETVSKIIQRPAIKDKNGNEIKLSAEETGKEKANAAIVYTGFAAQDVEKAAKSLNYDFSGVDAAKNDKDLYGLRYAEFVVPLVKAVQELSKMNDDKDAAINSLKSEIRNLKSENESLEQRIARLEALMNVSSSAAMISSASLEQNIPNPFSNTTTINYTLPQKFTSAQIVIRDKSGKTLKAVNISGGGKGNLKVDASTLASDAYQYSLIIDGRLIDTKQMVLAR
jgi:hypothetical protein